MTVVKKTEWLWLLVGDLIVLFISLLVALFVRHGGLFGFDYLMIHVVPFSLIFIGWLFFFYVFGLYQKHTLIFKDRLPALLLQTQVVNALVAVLFFYLTQRFVITPKLTLFIFLITSFFLILIWRLFGFNLFNAKNRQLAVLVGQPSPESDELLAEVNNNPRYNLFFVATISTEQNSAECYKQIEDQVNQYGSLIIVADLNNKTIQEITSKLYKLLLSEDVRFIDKYKVYEEIFDKVPLSLLHDDWFLKNIYLLPKPTYDFFKRGMDLFISFFLSLGLLIALPFVYLAIKFDDRGPIFYFNDRVGKGGKTIKIIKFRTLPVNPKGEWIDGHAPVLKAGLFLRKSRIDELPQLWNVLRGDLSLIGPRPELVTLVSEYEKEIPYYDVRHLITPGLSGWAQINQQKVPHHGVGIEETKIKLSYDLFYLKNRSFFLDIKIALRTIFSLLSRAGI